MEKRSWKNFDLLLLVVTILITGMGVALIYSATMPVPVPGDLTPLEWIAFLLEQTYGSQLVLGISGLLLLMLVATVDYRLLGHAHWLIYALAVGILILVRTIGQSEFGAQSWLSAQGAFQPSELSKVLVIVFLAKYIADQKENGRQLSWVLFSAALVLPLVFLIYLQPDLGTALVLVVIWFGMVFVGGVRLQHLGLMGLAAAAASPLVWFSLRDYMQQRILVFFQPSQDVSGMSYNTRQALTSIGSGGLFGKGFLHGTQSQLYFLRVRHTDFVFSVLCEELGFVGAVTLLSLFLILLWRILRAARLARDPFGQLVAAGVATMIFFQAFVNIAVNLGVLPVTGLTLPLISYGGSSLWTTLLGLGLVESVIMRHKKLDFGE